MCISDDKPETILTFHSRRSWIQTHCSQTQVDVQCGDINSKQFAGHVQSKDQNPL